MNEQALAPKLDLQLSVRKEGNQVVLGYHFTNGDEQPVVLVNFVAEAGLTPETDLQPVYVEPQAKGLVTVSQRALEEPQPPLSIRPLHSYLLVPAAKSHDVELRLALPLARRAPRLGEVARAISPAPTRLQLCLGTVPLAALGTGLAQQLVAGELKIAPISPTLAQKQHRVCSNTVAID
ncbi:hypothetical protein [Gloeobacter kilaueensis]|nr:hypothetical protein [Gloeobacter kilaueensis]